MLRLALLRGLEGAGVRAFRKYGVGVNVPESVAVLAVALTYPAEVSAPDEAFVWGLRWGGEVCALLRTEEDVKARLVEEVEVLRGLRAGALKRRGKAHSALSS